MQLLAGDQNPKVYHTYTLPHTSSNTDGKDTINVPTATV